VWGLAGPASQKQGHSVGSPDPEAKSYSPLLLTHHMPRHKAKLAPQQTCLVMELWQHMAWKTEVG